MCVRETIEQMTWTNAGWAKLCVGSSQSRWHVQFGFFPINPCHLFIVVFGCAGWTSKIAHVILYNLQQKGTWHEHTTEGKHTKKEWKHTQKIILRRFSDFNVIFLHVWWVFTRVSPKAGTKPRSCQKLENPFLNTFLIQIWRKNKLARKPRSCQKLSKIRFLILFWLECSKGKIATKNTCSGIRQLYQIFVQEIKDKTPHKTK